ncbi:ATP-binding protein [Streptomycetaceae bacterium NBC_01309]
MPYVRGVACESSSSRRLHFVRVDADPPAAVLVSPLEGAWLSATRTDLPDRIELEWSREKAWAAEPSAVGRARQLAWAACIDWRLPELSADVQLCVSELVANAVDHARPPHAESACGPWLVTLRLRFSPLRYVQIEVDDGDPKPPRTPEGSTQSMPDDNDLKSRGRGLILVANFADGLDWYARSTLGGKTVLCWFDLAARGLARRFRLRPTA